MEISPKLLSTVNLRRLRSRILACATLLIVLTPAGIFAHQQLEEQVARVTLALEKVPNDANLWLRRSDLHRQQRQYKLAIADLEQVARLKPNWPIVSLARANILYDSKRPQDALASATEFLKVAPNHAEAVLLQARCLAQIGAAAAAVEKHSRALRLFAEPTPDLFLEHARLQAALGRFSDAISCLDDGLARLGPAPALELAGIEYERQAGNFERALKRADAWVNRSSVKEPALLLKAELLEQTGNLVEARDVFQKVLAGLSSYPAHRRFVEASRQLERQAEDGLSRVGHKLARSSFADTHSAATRVLQ